PPSFEKRGDAAVVAIEPLLQERVKKQDLGLPEPLPLFQGGVRRGFALSGSISLTQAFEIYFFPYQQPPPPQLAFVYDRIISPEKRILITSFDVWMKGQKVNYSDILLGYYLDQLGTKSNFKVLHKLPVKTKEASDQVTQAMAEFDPHLVVMMGMGKSKLTLDQTGWRLGDKKSMKTNVEYDKINKAIDSAVNSVIGNSAGTFVCGGIYGTVLDHVYQNDLATEAVFIHVPRVDQNNYKKFVADLDAIIHGLAGGVMVQDLDNSGMADEK
ncbi:hypothetical protein ACFLZY_03555, partial [Patescibacteria group bacterium]